MLLILLFEIFNKSIEITRGPQIIKATIKYNGAINPHKVSAKK